MYFLKGKEKVARFVYDCIVIDIGLPYGSGLDIVKEMQYMESKAGIIIISAKNALEAKLKGLDLGADDYHAKPFYLSELTSRINAIIRRRNFGGNNVIAFNEINLEAEAQRVTVDGKAVALTDKEFQLLEYFIANPRRLLTAAAIAEHIWGDEY